MSRFKSSLLGASLLASLLSFAVADACFAEAPNADIRNGMQSPPAEQRVALVIGNSNYQIAPKLANPGNDAQSMAQLLNTAGFEVTQATDPDHVAACQVGRLGDLEACRVQKLRDRLRVVAGIGELRRGLIICIADH